MGGGAGEQTHIFGNLGGTAKNLRKNQGTGEIGALFSWIKVAQTDPPVGGSFC